MEGIQIRGKEFLDEKEKLDLSNEALDNYIDDNIEAETSPITDKEREKFDEMKPHECEMCGRRFAGEGGLALHMKGAHKIVGKKNILKTLAKNRDALLTQQVAREKKTELLSAKNFIADAETLAIIQMILNSESTDLNSLMKKMVYKYAYGTHFGGDNMEKKDDMGEFIKDMEKNKMKKQLYEEYQQADKPKQTMDDLDFGSIIRAAEQKYKLEMLTGLTSGKSEGVDFSKMMNQMMMTMMMRNMFEQPKQSSGEVEALKLQLAQMQQEILRSQQEAKDEKFRELMKVAVESKQEQKGSFQDFLLAMEKVKADYSHKQREMEMTLAEKDDELKRNENDKFKEEVMGQIRELSKKNIGNWGEDFQTKVRRKS